MTAIKMEMPIEPQLGIGFPNGLKLQENQTNWK
ncbi:hypothetical protein P872_01315 [Rhodonellum psychrophilum GCM71 = DSM 17998]|uniref:Uncharacterized protein n=1 Tax=Rhodonellum psychrophilum GCM71 = DSM 17998 TaxID=1123057 RepID=U5C6W6_9BACT|nr:hypothetical protein P872_01315 [Rhodonellum psychrophilum GCM71 = DSM 17998]